MSFLILKSVPRKKNRKFGQGRGWPQSSKLDHGTSPLPEAKESKAQPFYLAEPPQEFDEYGKELDADAQVWRTYVKEADRVDEELVDGWNKSMDVNLIFAALFSAISTAFVIESYKNLKQDPADVSAQTLLVISQTLSSMNNGSQTTNVPPTPDMEAPAFKASSTAICVNVLWFLSLSLSVAVSLVSMLAKEWCLEFMSGRIGPPGPQARRRQRRWDGVVGWKMNEVLVVLPSLIHLSLLLFAVGLCVFLWDVHYGVAIPVVIVTALAAGAYFACTILPYIDEYCPYGTVLSRLYKQFSNRHVQSARDTVTQDETTSRALHWMIVNCETPRSVDVALQSLAGSDGGLPNQMLQKCDAWTLIRQRIDSISPDGGQNSALSMYKRGLQFISSYRPHSDISWYQGSSAFPLLRLVFGVQSCINSAIDKLLGQLSPFDPKRVILDECTLIGPRLLKFEYGVDISYHFNKESGKSWIPWGRRSVEYDDNMHLTRSEALAEQVTEMLIRYMKGETDMEPLMPRVLSVCLVLLLCRKMVTNRVGSIKHVQKLIRAYQSQTSHNSDEVRIKMERERDRDLQSRSILAFMLGAISILNDNCTVEDSPCFSDRLPDDSQPMSPLLTSERVMEMTWKYLIAHVYPGTYSFGERRYALHGGFHLLMRSRDYGLDSNDCMAISKLMDENGAQYHSGSEVDDKCYPRHIQEYIAALAASPDLNALAPQLSTYLKYLRPMADRFQYISLTPEVYAMSLKALCQTNGDWEFADYGRLLLYSPFPKISPRLIDLLSTSGVFSWLVESLDEGGAEQRPFAIAQLWLLFNMSVQAPGPTSDTQSKLEEILLQYPGLENSPEKREEAMMDLETRLFVLLDQNEDTIRYRYVGTYLCRVLECMLQQRCTPLPEWTHEELEHIPGRLRGIGSLVDLEANTSESPSNQNSTNDDPAETPSDN